MDVLLVAVLALMLVIDLAGVGAIAVALLRKIKRHN